MNLNHTEAEMGRIGKELRRRFRQSLSQQGKKSSGTLSRSIRYENYTRRGEVFLDFEMAPYADFVNKGVRGSKRSPFPGQSKSPYKYGSGRGRKGGLRKGIDKWVVRKGLKGTRDDRGRFVSRKSMVFLISRAIYERGLKPTYFIDRPLDRMEKEISKRLAKAYEKDLQEYLNKNLQD